MESYRRNLSHMKSSTRPHLVRTKGDIDLFDIRGGHLFIGEDFTARDPSTEVRRTQRAVFDREQAVATGENELEHRKRAVFDREQAVATGVASRFRRWAYAHAPEWLIMLKRRVLGISR